MENGKKENGKKKEFKTLIFYSYKGGQGRSTAVANIATALYRLNQKVLVLDLDIESPGLPPKLIGESVFHGDRVETAGGFVPYIVHLDDGPEEDQHRARSADSSIERTAIAVDPEEARLFRLIPTGIVSKTYHNFLAEPVWVRFTTRDRTDAQQTHLGKRVLLLDKFAEAARALTPDIDYLLVDLASGMTPLAQSVFAAWAGPILLFFSLDQENIEGTRYILNSIQGIEDLRNTALGERAMAVKPYPVLSRLGPFISEERAWENRQKAADLLELPEASADRVLYLRSDPDLETEWKLRIPVSGDPVNNALTNDYLRIIATILPDLATGASIEERVQNLRRALGMPENVSHLYKAFRLDEGALVNLSDEERNVSFKVGTFCSILDDLHTNMLAELKRSHQKRSKKVVESEFLQAGLVSGQRFGQSLAKLWAERGDKDDLSGLLQFWCHFDSDVGFGVLSAEVTRLHPVQGWVRIKDNFLAAGRSKDDHPANLCKLLAGYISGILQAVVHVPFDIRHPLTHCMRTAKERRDCEFSFKEDKEERTQHAELKASKRPRP